MGKPALWSAAGILGLAVTMGLLLLFLLPSWAERTVTETAATTLHLPFSTGSGAHLAFSGGLSVRFDDVDLGSASAGSEPLVHADAIVIPVSLGDLLTGRFNPAAIGVEGATISLRIGERGNVNWPTEPGRATMAASFDFSNAAVHFADARSGQAFDLADANFGLEVTESGEAIIDGTAGLNGAFVRIETYVKDVGRLTTQGSPVDISLTAPALEASFSGRLSTAGALALAGTASVSGPDLRQALAWTGASIGEGPGFKAFAISGALDARGFTFSLRNSDVSVDEIRASGDLGLDGHGTISKFTAALAASPIDIGKYIRRSTPENDWDTRPIDLAGLRKLDADVALTTNYLASDGADLGPARISVTLAGGRLDAQAVATNLPETELVVDGSSDVPSIALHMHGNLRTELLGPLVGIGWLEGGGDATIDLAANGRTEQEMISTLAGAAKVELGSGRFKGLDVARALAAVSREMQKAWPAKPSDATPFSTLSANMTIADGIATIQTMKLAGPRLQVSATGDVDLLRRALDLRADPRLATGKPGELVGLPVAVVIKGPWGTPRLFPDMAGAETDPDAAYRALRAQGMPSFTVDN